MKYILSLDAGGIRGIATIQFLKRLDNYLFVKKGKHINEFFDMFVGSSIGGIIALGISAGVNSDTFDKVFSTENMKLVFSQNSYTSYVAHKIMPQGLRNVPKYGKDGLEHLLNTYLPDISLNQLKKPTLVISYNLDEHKTIIYKQSNINVRVLGRLTSAAPTYFSCAKCPSGNWHVDGGIAISNPSLTAYIEGKELWDEFKILSVGTGYKNIKIDGHSAQQWGLIKWALNDGMHVLVDAPCRVISEQCQQLLKDKYLRINSELIDTNYDLDDVSPENYNKFKNLGHTWFDDNLENINLFFDIKSSKL